MTMIDLDDIKAYLDDKITDETANTAAVTAVIGQPVPPILNARIVLLEEIRKEMEWIEVNGYTPRRPEPGQLAR